MQASIIIADDHPLILKGLKDFLVEKKFNVLATAENGKKAFSLIKTHDPDIAILDINMPFLSGIEVAEKCLEEGLNQKIIIITFEKDEALYNKAKELNIFGYVLKEFALNEIENCIESVIANKPYFSPELLQFLESETPPEGLDKLTETEIKTLRLIAKNKTANEIGKIMFSSGRTVEKHKSNIRNKLKLESKAISLFVFANEVEAYLSKNS